MKKLLLFFAVMLLCITESYSQASFTTGALRVDVNQYGRVQLFTPDNTKQLERASILVGKSETAVFDYTNDAESLDPTVLVTNPLLSDFEIYGSYNNAYSGLPPDIVEKLNVYGWNNGGYTILQFRIKNNETTSMTASIGLDIIPDLNDTYGFDTVSYNSSKEVIRFHRGNQENIGLKLLSASLSSLYSFEWYDGYTVDSAYWSWMNYGSLQPLYASNTADGPVTITSQDPVVIAPGQSLEVFYAFAIGANEQSMFANITAAAQQFLAVFTSVGNLASSADEFNLGQNYPNPFDQSTTISYQLPENGFVNLKVYNIIGNEVAALVNSIQTKGSHTIHFDAKDLPGGVYYCKLMFNDQVRSDKMFLVK